jgi:hypothetical protein
MSTMELILCGDAACNHRFGPRPTLSYTPRESRVCLQSCSWRAVRGLPPPPASRAVTCGLCFRGAEPGNGVRGWQEALAPVRAEELDIRVARRWRAPPPPPPSPPPRPFPPNPPTRPGASPSTWWFHPPRPPVYPNYYPGLRDLTCTGEFPG